MPQYLVRVAVLELPKWAGEREGDLWWAEPRPMWPEIAFIGFDTHYICPWDSMKIYHCTESALKLQKWILSLAKYLIILYSENQCLQNSFHRARSRFSYEPIAFPPTRVGYIGKVFWDVFCCFRKHLRVVWINGFSSFLPRDFQHCQSEGSFACKLGRRRLRRFDVNFITAQSLNQIVLTLPFVITCLKAKVFFRCVRGSAVNLISCWVNHHMD